MDMDKITSQVEQTDPNHFSDDDLQDAADMARLGKVQRFSRRFGLLSILGFAAVTMITWEGLLVTFSFSLANGGPAGSIFEFIFVWVGYGLTVVSMAELMSMWPTSGGQYHWTYTLAPARLAPILSYLTGWQSVIAWQAATASALYLLATSIQGLIVLNHPDTYHFERWHGTLLIYASVACVLTVGIFGNRLLPAFNILAGFIHVVGFVVVIAVIATLTPTKATTSEVFDVWFGNYSSRGVSFLAGLQGIIFAWLGADGPVHLAEEIKGAARVVPWCLLINVIINGGLGIGMMISVFLYGPIGADLATAIQSPTGYPYQAILTYATGSTHGGTGLAVIPLIMMACATLMVFTATTRELWAFARDNGVPGASFLRRVDKKTELPLYCYAVTATVSVLLALINIGSALAFNAIVSLTVAAYLASYGLCLTLILWRRVMALFGKGPQLPWGPWRLGHAGILINGLGLAWLLVAFVFSFFPIAPVSAGLTVQSMNWSSLAYGAIMIFAIIFWLAHGRRTFKGPVRDAFGDEIEAVLGWEQGEFGTKVN